MGATSEPCCIKLPTTNQTEFCMLHWFTRYFGSSTHGYGLFHSPWQSLPMMNMDTATASDEAINISQTSGAKGSAKEKKLGGAFFGFW